MEKNQNQTEQLSIKAIEAKARREAAIAEINARQPKRRSRLSRTAEKRPRTTIEQEINAIYQALIHNASDDETVVLSRPDKAVSCRAMISIYRQSDLLRQKDEEMAYKKALSAGADRRMLVKPFKARPVTMYSLYAGVVNPNKLGSIAIYGDNPHATLHRILISGHLLGHAVKRASIEMGLRPFVDVTLAS